MGNMTEIIHVLLTSISLSVWESLIIPHPPDLPSWYTMYCTWYDNKETAALRSLRATHHPARSHAHKSSLEPVLRASLLLRPGHGGPTLETLWWQQLGCRAWLQPEHWNNATSRQSVAMIRKLGWNGSLIRLNCLFPRFPVRSWDVYGSLLCSSWIFISFDKMNIPFTENNM